MYVPIVSKYLLTYIFILKRVKLYTEKVPILLEVEATFQQKFFGDRLILIRIL